MYGHWLDGDLIYIGSGQPKRAFETRFKWRCVEWCLASARSNSSVEVHILASFGDNRKAAVAYERLLLGIHKPCGNSLLELAGGWRNAIDSGREQLAWDHLEVSNLHDL